MKVNGYTIEPGADLRRANLGRANLERAAFGGPRLEGVVVDGRTVWPDDYNPGAWTMFWIGPGANLAGADLAGADLAGANLAGAVADESTVWLEGFDPEAAGVTFK